MVFVPGVHNFALKNTQRGQRYGKFAESQKNSRKQEITWARQRNKITERSWTPTSMTRSTKCTYTSNDTRNPTWKSLTIFVSSSGERACFRETHAGSYIPTKEASTPWRPKNKVNKKVLWKRFLKNKTKNF